jgi:multisubunit Na+/H+ antiporter MnhB subunit
MLRGDFSVSARRDIVAGLLVVGSAMIFCLSCFISAQFSTPARQKYQQKHMHWFFDDISNLFVQLRRWQTWLGIGLISVFAGLAYLVGTYALRTDGLLLYLHRTAGACRELTNGIIIFMFCGMIFFMLTALLTLGEFQRYFQFKQRAAHFQASRALYWGIGWGFTAVGIAVAALVFFNSYCR